MSLTTQYSSGAYTRRIAQIKSQSIVEIRFSEDIGEVVAVYPQVSTSSCEVNSGRVTYGGRLVCTIVYADGDGKLCRIQKGAEFSHFADDVNLAPAHRGVCSLTAERAQAKRDGSSCLVSAVISADIDIYGSAERSFLTSAEGAVCKRESAKLASVVTFSGESEVEDEFDCNAEDILVPAAEVIVTDCNCRAGTAEINGEIYLSLLAVRDGAPVCFDRTIPFKSQLAIDDALLQRKAFCRAEIRDINVTAKVNEERGKCGVELIATLSFSGSYFEEEEVSVISDAFSCTNALDLSFAEENYAPCTGIKVYSERVSGLCATKARLDYTCAFLATALPRAEYVRTPSGLEGSVSANLLYIQNGEIRSTEVNLPFTVTLNGFTGSGNVGIAVCGISVRQRAEGECEAEAQLKIAAAECGEVRTVYLADATEGADVSRCDSAVSVYIPHAGDGLWETAKKLGRPPEDIEATNPELTYPLSGKERIVVYRAKSV